MQEDLMTTNEETVARIIDPASESRTTASGDHSCEQCGKPLSGRKERFCSDGCRMRTAERRKGFGSASCSQQSRNR